jgi:eukaryotic-like serine/threonine-protein kinase
MLTRDAPKSLGRFEIVRPLGAGAQGAVYLARDSRLGREVAIKTLHLQRGRKAPTGDPLQALLDEARIVSQLTHPNIVTLYDADDHGGTPYLVFEFVSGTPLNRRLRERGPLEPARAVDIAIQVLRAVGHAHRKGVLHRDIKPGNIMLTGDETARVMDFGIAQLIAAGAPDSEEFCGTPAYIAPEAIAERRFSPRSDVFAAGMVLYEMLTGQPAVTGQNVFEVLNRIANEPFVAPATLNGAVDDRLNDIVMKSLAKDPEQRYESAQHMENALYLYLNPDTGDGDGPAALGSTQGTLEFLLRRMRHKSDFPALSSTIGAVNRATASDTEAVNSLSGAILKDFALTNKLLKLVNTAYYGQFGGTISTISRAIVILGFDRVRSVAITLLLFEHLQNKQQAARLKDDIVGAYFGGILARELVGRAGIRNAEEAFICSVFHRLGKLLSRFYFPEEDNEIEKLIRQKNMDEDRASLNILGISFEDLGIGVAKAWNFPPRLINSMKRVRDDKVKRGTREEDRLAALAEFSSGVSEALRDAGEENPLDALKELARKFGDGLGVSNQLLLSSVERSVKELEKDSSSLGISFGESLFLKRATACAPESEEVPTQKLDPSDQALQDTVLNTADFSAGDLPPPARATSAERKAALSAGIQDITNTLVGEYKLNDVLRIILETMFRSIGFTRVLLFVRDPARGSFQSRFGLGADVDRIIASGFGFRTDGKRDVFQAAVSKGVDIFIENVDAEAIRDHIPDWFRKVLPAHSFALFPIVVNGKPIGLFYGDAEQSGSLHFQSDELALLKTLRNQAVLAIKNQQ